VNVVADDFLSLNLEGISVTEDVFCAFMVDDPDGIGRSLWSVGGDCVCVWGGVAVGQWQR